MSNVIKLTEKDLRSIIGGVIEEQLTNPQPQPSGAAVPTTQTQKPTSPMAAAPTNEMHVDGEGKVVEGGLPEILAAKRAVRHHLDHAHQHAKKLTHLSGINPDANTICKDLEEVINTYESLYGLPKPKEVKQPKK
jgi:hypothetical protein